MLRYIMTIRSVILIAVILLTATMSFARFGWETRQLSLYYGTTYRIKDRFYNSIEVTYEKISRSCLRGDFVGLGLRFDYFKTGNFALGIEYYDTFLKQRRIPGLINPFWGFSPVMFYSDNTAGLNIKPEVGIRLNTGHYSMFGLGISISYGYDIPIINELNFSPGRHDISARIAVATNLGKLFNNKSKDTEDNEES